MLVWREIQLAAMAVGVRRCDQSNDGGYNAVFLVPMVFFIWHRYPIPYQNINSVSYHIKDFGLWNGLNYTDIGNDSRCA